MVGVVIEAFHRNEGSTFYVSSAEHALFILGPDCSYVSRRDLLRPCPIASALCYRRSGGSNRAIMPYLLRWLIPSILAKLEPATCVPHLGSMVAAQSLWSILTILFSLRNSLLLTLPLTRGGLSNVSVEKFYVCIC